ncbi:hypothetical protein Pme01_25400 [Planosporangium mesophilum]|uniref:Uncharacterized protein n=1 Tax=Planosporangium mesophilum TaxID=689768 RepID=A0A8J3TAG2_9ACTN|nr:hypothetical protein Pme01_25400 [Planosporangium mesophilum]
MLIKTTSCDVGVRIDLSCDSCDLLFLPRPSTPQVLSAVWKAAAARGWKATEPGPRGRHYCPACADLLAGGRVAEVVEPEAYPRKSA